MEEDVVNWTPFLKILYPVTATLSVELDQVKSICEEEITVVVSPEGTLGAVVSGGGKPAWVVAEADTDCAELFPAAS